MNNLKLRFKKVIKITIILLLGLAVLGYLVGDDKKPEEKSSSVDKKSKDQKIDQKVNNDKPNGESSKNIPGIEPIDIYGNFEKRGFKVDKQLNEDGSFFISTLDEKGISYEAKVYCEAGATDVTTIRFSATRMFPQYNRLEDIKPFLKYGCSVPYDNADPEKINEFIDANYYKDKASIIISGVKFTIFCPTKFYRMIDVEMP